MRCALYIDSKTAQSKILIVGWLAQKYAYVNYAFSYARIC